MSPSSLVDKRTALSIALLRLGVMPLYNVVWRCRLIVSKPVLKAPMVSALEATIC